MNGKTIVHVLQASVLGSAVGVAGSHTHLVAPGSLYTVAMQTLGVSHELSLLLAGGAYSAATYGLYQAVPYVSHFCKEVRTLVLNGYNPEGHWCEIVGERGVPNFFGSLHYSWNPTDRQHDVSAEDFDPHTGRLLGGFACEGPVRIGPHGLKFNVRGFDIGSGKKSSGSADLEFYGERRHKKPQHYRGSYTLTIDQTTRTFSAFGVRAEVLKLAPADRELRSDAARRAAIQKMCELAGFGQPKF